MPALPLSAAALNRAVEVFTAGALEDKASAAGAHHPSAGGVSGTEAGHVESSTNGAVGPAALRAVAAKVAQLEELLAQLSPKVGAYCLACRVLLN